MNGPKLDTCHRNMFWKSQPEYEFYCKCHNEQFHFSNPLDDMIEKTEHVVILLVMTMR